MLHHAAHGQYQLQAPAADVRHDGASPDDGEVLAHRQEREASLGLAVDDLEGDADLALHPLGEVGAVRSVADCRGRYQGDPRRAPPLGRLLHSAQGFDGPLDRLIREAAGGREAARQARLVLEVVYDVEVAVVAALGDQAADRVGSDVYRREPLSRWHRPSA